MPEELARQGLANAGAAARDDHPEGRVGRPPQPPGPHHPRGRGKAAQQAPRHCWQPQRGQGRRTCKCEQSAKAGDVVDNGQAHCQYKPGLANSYGYAHPAPAPQLLKTHPAVAHPDTHLPAAQTWLAARLSPPPAQQAGACPPDSRWQQLLGGWSQGRQGRRCPTALEATLQLSSLPLLLVPLAHHPAGRPPWVPRNEAGQAQG